MLAELLRCKKCDNYPMMVWVIDDQIKQNFRGSMRIISWRLSIKCAKGCAEVKSDWTPITINHVTRLSNDMDIRQAYDDLNQGNYIAQQKKEMEMHCLMEWNLLNDGVVKSHWQKREKDEF